MLTSARTSTSLQDLIARQRQGWSLEQPFYVSKEIFDFERYGWLAEQWFLLAHRSEVSDLGAIIVRELLGESILLVRDHDGALRAFYNVCRHRGSRICDTDGRGARGITCPYHAWSYRLDGSFRAAPALSKDVDTAKLGLRPLPVRDIGGLILVSLSSPSVSLDAVKDALEPGLTYHGIPEARIAARRSYPTRANWKLVMENFLECYHCLPCHPEFASVMQVDAIARVPPDNGEAWRQTLHAWFRDVADPNAPLPLRADFPTESYGAGRRPIGAGRKTQSKDGTPVAPLLGRLRGFDGGVSSFRLEPFVFLAALNDHAVMFQFLPISAESTDVILTWLVDASASADEVDLEKMVWLWDVTTTQDKAIIERNAAGVRSRAYLPGPYSTLEGWTARLVSQYLKGLSTPVPPQRSVEAVTFGGECAHG